jgi:hypothetical protein
MPPLRQARLKAEFAPFYPGIQAEEWLPARDVADRVLARILDRSEVSDGLRQRVLPPEHFDFRDRPFPTPQAGSASLSA